MTTSTQDKLQSILDDLGSLLEEEDVPEERLLQLFTRASKLAIQLFGPSFRCPERQEPAISTRNSEVAT